MEVFTTVGELPARARCTVVAIGNFDGVHRGHQALLAAARAQADERRVPLAVLSFEPHPRRLFRPDEAAFRLTPLPVKTRRLQECGVDFLFALPFDWNFASQTAEQFAHDILQQRLAPAHVVVGADFRFGQLRRGSAQTLRDKGMTVTTFEKVSAGDGVDISSSAIRDAVRRADLALANNLLGWDWVIEGEIMHGDKRGRTLGYPTANVPLGETLHPAYGIYASRVRIGDATEWLPAATNIGIRPMFELALGQTETFIFDFDRDIYGQRLQIQPVRRLRGEAKFESLEALITQMAEDCRQARALLSA